LFDPVARVVSVDAHESDSGKIRFAFQRASLPRSATGTPNPTPAALSLSGRNPGGRLLAERESF